MSILVEACVESLASARQAAAAGAGRLELCSNLAEGGTTPSPELLAAVREQVTIPLHLMVRPRPGDFCYSEPELQAMQRAIELARRAGVAGVVFGTLDPAGRIDRRATQRLLAAARPLTLTFHRAFDQTADPFEALDTLIALGVDRVLTAGHAESAEAGIPTLKALVTRGAGRITVLAGGGVRAANAARIVQESGVRELHLQAGPDAEWVRDVVKSVSREQ